MRCPHCGSELAIELALVPRLVPEDPHDPLLPEEDLGASTWPGKESHKATMTSTERVRAYRERKKLEGK